MTFIASGAILGDFRIEGVIGRGGMGVVYRAVQMSLDRPVALKLIAPALAEEPGFRERFERESRLAASLDHPHVVPVFAAGEQDGLLFIAMRLVDGPNLGTLIRAQGQLEPPRAARIVAQVASALDEAHRLGLVHRDVKPANVLLSERGGEEHAYLTDFGVTKRTESLAGLTGSGSWVGTLDYVAPEQLRGGLVDGRADVYSLGCVLFEALTGRVPFPREDDVAKLWAHISDPPPVADEVVPAVPRLLAYVARRAMAKLPEERFQSAGELGRAALAAEPAEPATVPLRERPPPRRPRRRRRAVLAIAVLLAAGLAGAVTLTGDRGSRDGGRVERPPPRPEPAVDVPPGPRIGPLAQLGGERGCLSSGTVGGCAPTRSMEGASDLAISPDGRSAYVAARDSGSVVVLSRDPASGTLTQLPGKAGCLTHRLQEECSLARGLGGARSVAVSRDGRTVYVAAPGSQAVAVFARDGAGGELRQLFGSAGCVRRVPGEGCTTAAGLPRPVSIEAKADGSGVYVAGTGGVAELVARPGRRGALAPLPGPRGCSAERGPGCRVAAGVGDARDLAEAPGGRHLYVAGGSRDRLVVLERAGGGLAAHGTRCIAQRPARPQCKSGRALRLPLSVAVSPGGGSLYVASHESDGIAVLHRDGRTGALSQPPGPRGCAVQAGAGGCTEGRALDGVSAVALSPDGRNLYSVSRRIHALALFSLGSSGELRRLPGSDGCHIRFGVLECARGRALSVAEDIALDPEGHNVYVVSAGRRIGGIAVFQRLRP